MGNFVDPFMKSHWDQRYAGDIYAYGKEPNYFFRLFINSLPPGKILLPGEGEGRNAVYAAGKGWHVFALDQSTEGQRKAMNLAREKGVEIRYDIGDLANIDYPESSFDVVSLIFVHLPPEIRQDVHAKLISMLRPGGIFHMVAFKPEQLQHQTGGPRDLRLLYDEALLRQDLSALIDLRFFHIDSFFEEGPHHLGRFQAIEVQGKAAV